MAFAPSPAASRTTIVCSSPHPTASTATAVTVSLKPAADAAKAQGNNALLLLLSPGHGRPPPPPAQLPGRRAALSACLTALTLSLASAGPSRAAILEADDDEELLEKVKKDRKKRLERQGVISSSGKETGYLQEVIYRLSKVAQAIENNDLSAASSVLGPGTNVDWVQKVNTAFTKLSSSPEEKIEVNEFNANLTSLFTSVGKRDVESAKLAFVSSASALEKWVELTGLIGQLKGL